MEGGQNFIQAQITISGTENTLDKFSLTAEEASQSKW